MLVAAGLALLVANFAGTAAAIGWLSERTTLSEQLTFSRGTRPDFAFAGTIERVVTLAQSGAATRIVLEIAPPAVSQQSVADAEAKLAEDRLAAAVRALREAGLDRTGVPVVSSVVAPVAEAAATVDVSIERMAASN